MKKISATGIIKIAGIITQLPMLILNFILLLLGLHDLVGFTFIDESMGYDIAAQTLIYIKY